MTDTQSMRASSDVTNTVASSSSDNEAFDVLAQPSTANGAEQDTTAETTVVAIALLLTEHAADQSPH